MIAVRAASGDAAVPGHSAVSVALHPTHVPAKEHQHVCATFSLESASHTTAWSANDCVPAVAAVLMIVCLECLEC